MERPPMPDAHGSNSVGTPFSGSSSDDIRREKQRNRDAFEPEPTEKRPPLWSRAWDRTGLNSQKIIVMIKGALPPVITLALYQHQGFANTLQTLGYLAAIMSVICSAFLPRAKFLQIILFNTIGICLGAAYALLVCYCGVKAREHTSAPNIPPTVPAPYNSSQSAVCGLMLFINIVFANVMRLKRPQMQMTTIMYSIFANVSATNAPTFPNMEISIIFVKRLMEAFLVGFAVATVINLFIFPTSSRIVIFEHYRNYINSIKSVVNAEKEYLWSMENPDMLEPQYNSYGEEKASKTDMAARKLKTAMAGLSGLHAIAHADLLFAKREVAWGKLQPEDLDTVFQLFRKIFLPLLGLTSVTDIFERYVHSRGWKPHREGLPEAPESREKRLAEQREWNELMITLHGPSCELVEAMDDGLDHVSWLLEFSTMPRHVRMRRKKHIEDSGLYGPGHKDFGRQLVEKIRAFHEKRRVTIRLWCKQKGLTFPSDGEMENPTSRVESLNGVAINEMNRHQLYMLLYMDFLLTSTGREVLALVRWADSKVESGQMARNRIIVPGWGRMWHWITWSMSKEDSSADWLPDHQEAGVSSIALGDAFQARKDPEHLPPANAWEMVGNHIRSISHFFGSQEASFGFRAACATMTIGIIAFLQNTQTFFIQQRLVWAMIMISIGMTMTTGSSIFAFVGRVLGSLLAIATALALWYISGGRGEVAGVLVMLFFLTMGQIYVMVYYPKLFVIVLIMMVTQILVLGYELEIQTSGIPFITQSGQAYWPIYILAPIRFLQVSTGCFVAWVWSYFPYPVTARAALRQQLGQTLYLLANFYSIVHVTVGARLRKNGGDLEDEGSPNAKLEKERAKLLAKILAFIADLRKHMSFIVFEPSLGGKFPKTDYAAIIEEGQNLTNYIALIAYSTKDYTRDTEIEDSGHWIHAFADLVASSDFTSHRITSMLSLLSSALIQGNPLPPYMKAPSPYRLAETVEEKDPEILGVQHVLEPGYAAFAVTQIASKLISNDLSKLLSHVKTLVGEVDFSFHVISTGDWEGEKELVGEGKIKSE